MPSMPFMFHLPMRQVDAALGLFLAAPAAGARVFARRDAVGARHAADREEAVGLQRVARQVVALEVGVEVGLLPVGQRIDLDPAVVAVDLDPLQLRPRAALEALAAGDPGVEALERALQRLDLAEWQHMSGLPYQSTPSGSSASIRSGSGLIVRTSLRPSSAASWSR